ncbi:MAG: hypothetical protein AAF703_08810 [Cyanobacteria bacterium P01_D01_bin.105]
MQYLYYFANTSLVVRLLTYLSKQVIFPLKSVTVIYLVDRWVVRIQLQVPLPTHRALDFEAFLKENGYLYSLTTPIARPVREALAGLDAGLSVTAVMEKYHVVVVSHGALQLANVENFRSSFVEGLGYCPPSLV